MLRLQAYPSLNNVSCKLTFMILWMKYGQSEFTKIRWNGVQDGKLLCGKHVFLFAGLPFDHPAIPAPFHSHCLLGGFTCARWIPMCWVLTAPWEALQKLDVGSYAWPCCRCRHVENLSGGWRLTCWIAWELFDRKLHENNHIWLIYMNIYIWLICWFIGYYAWNVLCLMFANHFSDQDPRLHFQHARSSFH